MLMFAATAFFLQEQKVQVHEFVSSGSNIGVPLSSQLDF